jgi:hypothetical protein
VDVSDTGSSPADEPRAHRPGLRDPPAPPPRGGGDRVPRASRGSLPVPPGSIGPFGQDQPYGPGPAGRKGLVHDFVAAGGRPSPNIARLWMACGWPVWTNQASEGRWADPVTRRTCLRSPARARCDRRGGRGAREPGGARWPPGPAPPVRVVEIRGPGMPEAPPGDVCRAFVWARLGVPGRGQQPTEARRDDVTAFREGSVKEPSGSQPPADPLRRLRPASSPRRCRASPGGARCTP